MQKEAGKRCTCNAHRDEYSVEDGDWKGRTASECTSCGNTVYFINLEEEKSVSPNTVNIRSFGFAAIPQGEMLKQYNSLWGLGGAWDGCALYPEEIQEKENKKAKIFNLHSHQNRKKSFAA